jgi:hypothetical protein
MRAAAAHGGRPGRPSARDGERKKRLATDNESIDPLSAERGEGRFDLGLARYVLHDQFPGSHRSFQLAELVVPIWIGRIAHKADKFRRGHCGKQHFQLLRAHRGHEEGCPGHAAARPAQAWDQPFADRIAPVVKIVGMLVPTALTAWTVPPPATITATCRRTRSATRSGIRS